MAIRNITIRGNEVLAKKCKPVKEITPRVRELCLDMIDTMNEADGVGLAAPQVGILKRIFVAMPFPDESDEVYVMINPEITCTEGTQESNEGCLSIPGYMGLVDRPQTVRVKYTDLEGEEHEDEFTDFAATVISHENDHLDGILYSDKARDFMTSEEYYEKLQKVINEHEHMAHR